MKSPVIIAGLEHSGKTSFICSILQIAQKRQIKGAAFKPFDSGLIKRNANELLSDGELFCQNMTGEPMETLVSPYCANEDYPLEMSLRRDGIRINWPLIKERLKLLEDLYDFTCIEVPGSLLTSVTENKMVIDWIKELDAEIIWMLHPTQNHFHQNLAELKLMMDHNLDFTIVFNNASKLANQDLVFYIWEKIEKMTNQEAAGMIPFIVEPEDPFTAMAGRIEEDLAGLLDSFIQKPRD
jgi:dethiobiotin synthetase